MEFAAELHDLVKQDLSKIYPSLTPLVTITIYDVAPKVLSMFDEALGNYAVKFYRREGIQIKTQHIVENLTKGLPQSKDTDPRSANSNDQINSSSFTLRTKQEGDIGIGICVWSTGLMMNPFVKKALSQPWHLESHALGLTAAASGPVSPGTQPFMKAAPWTVMTQPRSGAILTDNRLRVKVTRPGKAGEEASEEAVIKDVFAIGDVGAMEGPALPATAQVANQKAEWLAKRLNKGDLDEETFTYKNLGVMTNLGGYKAILQGENNVRFKGFVRPSCLIPVKLKSA